MPIPNKPYIQDNDMWDPLIRSFFPNTPPLHLYFSLSERMVAGPDPSSPPNPTLACLLARWTVGPGRSRSAAHSSPRAVLLDATRSWGRLKLAQPHRSSPVQRAYRRNQMRACSNAKPTGPTLLHVQTELDRTIFCASPFRLNQRPTS